MNKSSLSLDKPTMSHNQSVKPTYSLTNVRPSDFRMGDVLTVRSSSSMQSDEKELMTRFPDTGHLSIQDFEHFMRRSKATFLQKWASLKSTRRKQKTSSVTEYILVRLLGGGAFGYVVLAQHETSKEYFALKCVDKMELVKTNHLENIKTEYSIMECINYPFTTYLLQFFRGYNYIYILMPFVEGGDLFAHLRLSGLGNEDNARFFASQVILALEYLHFLDFVYRDLKPENVLIDHTGYLKLTDFGFTKRLKRKLRTYTMCGTPEYLAPEIVLNKGHGKAVDWWATGCFIYELVTGYTPFVSASAEKVFKKIVARSLVFPKTFSPELKDIVDRLLQVDLSKRYGNLKNGVADIKQHKWFVVTNWMAILNRTIEAPYKPKRATMEMVDGQPWKLPKEDTENKLEDYDDF